MHVAYRSAAEGSIWKQMLAVRVILGAYYAQSMQLKLGPQFMYAVNGLATVIDVTCVHTNLLLYVASCYQQQQIGHKAKGMPIAIRLTGDEKWRL